MQLITILPGIIWSGFLGLVMGNLATSPIYRLPRNESLFAKDPFCDSCRTPLTTRDLFPVFSWLISRGRCRTCGASVPAAYTITEAFVCALFILCYLRFGFSEQFILISLGMTSFTALAMMLYQDRFFSDKTLVVCLALGMLHRTLAEGTIYGFAGGAFAGLLIGAASWRLSKQPLTRDVAAFPSYIKLLVAAGVWLAKGPFIAVLVWTGVVALMTRKQRKASAETTPLTELTIIASILLLSLTHILS